MVRNLKQLDRSKLTAKDSARIYASRKRYLIKVEDDCSSLIIGNDMLVKISRRY